MYSDIKVYQYMVWLERDQMKDLFERGIWKTKDGTHIPITEMTTSHLINTVAMIDRNMSMYKEMDFDLAILKVKQKMEQEIRRRQALGGNR